jgi:hypothetical protein
MSIASHKSPFKEMGRAVRLFVELECEVLFAAASG